MEGVKVQKFFEEFGKHMLNFALALIVALVFQPVVNGHFNFKFAIWAVIGYVSLIAGSLAFFWLSDRLENRKDGED